jgi:RHS repeat-associated protein
LAVHFRTINEYDANGNLTNLWSTNASGVSNVYRYDALSRLTNVQANGSTAATYGYDPVGNLQSGTFGNGVTNLYQYDTLNRVTSAVWKLSTSTLASFNYQLGLAGNRTNLSETVNGTSRTNQWQYDSIYRMTGEVITGLGTNGYGYDNVGNRTNQTTSISTGVTNQTFAFNANDWLTNTDQYDSNGNTTNSTGNYYKYDVMNHLTNGNGSVVITYDGDGNRASETVGGGTTYYLLDDRNPTGYTQVLEEYTGTNLSRVYNYGLALISQRQISGNTVSYYGYDGHGSTRCLMTSAGAITNTYVYDVYGALIASSGTTSNDYLYCGQQYDSNLGIYYNRARYLNQNTGRFWTMDTDDTSEGDNEDPLSLHKYLYCQADPVNGIDPSGHDDDVADLSVGEDLSAGLDALPNVMPSLASIAFPGAVRVVIDLASGAPNTFNRTAVQETLRNQIAGTVFNGLSGGQGVQISVITGLPGPQVGWSGNPKSQYINQVSWTHGTLTRQDFAYSLNGKTTIDLTHIGAFFAGKSYTEGTQFWVNLLAHEVFWINAGNNSDNRSAPIGELSSPNCYALSPFDVLPSTRATLLHEFGF